MSYIRRARAHMKYDAGLASHSAAGYPMGLGDKSVYETVVNAANQTYPGGAGPFQYNPNLTVTPIINPNLTVTPIAGRMQASSRPSSLMSGGSRAPIASRTQSRSRQRFMRHGGLRGLGDTGAYSWSAAALAAAVASGQTLAVVTMTTQNNFSVVPITDPSQYAAYQSQADAGVYSYVALYEYGGLYDEYFTGVVTAESFFDKLESPWVLAAIGGVLVIAVWSTREKKRTKAGR